MMNNEEIPYSVAHMKCQHCGDEWVAVYTTFEPELECPCCGKMTGGVPRPEVNA